MGDRNYKTLEKGKNRSLTFDNVTKQIKQRHDVVFDKSRKLIRIWDIVREVNTKRWLILQVKTRYFGKRCSLNFKQSNLWVMCPCLTLQNIIFRLYCLQNPNSQKQRSLETKGGNTSFAFAIITYYNICCTLQNDFLKRQQHKLAF